METQEEYKALVKTELQISIGDVKKYIAPNATDKELFMFMGICKSYGLNPFKREIHFVKYGTTAANIIVGYENYLKRAERTGKLDGWKCWIDKDDIGEKAIIEIKRKDQSLPVHWEVYRKEFDKQQSTWKTMPMFMLKKVAIAQGFRLAFPDDLGGMPYIPEELPQTKDATSENLSKDTIDIKEESPPVQEEKKTTVTADQKGKINELMIAKGLKLQADRKPFYTYVMTTDDTTLADTFIEKFDEYLAAYNRMIDAKNQPEAPAL